MLGTSLSEWDVWFGLGDLPGRESVRQTLY